MDTFSTIAKHAGITLGRDTVRLLALVALGSALIFYSPEVGTWLNEPAFAPWGLFTGGAFYIVAFTHLIRRIMFTYLNMPELARTAGRDPVGAGLVFVGICIVLSALAVMLGAMIRV